MSEVREEDHQSPDEGGTAEAGPAQDAGGEVVQPAVGLIDLDAILARTRPPCSPSCLQTRCQRARDTLAAVAAAKAAREMLVAAQPILELHNWVWDEQRRAWAKVVVKGSTFDTGETTEDTVAYSRADSGWAESYPMLESGPRFA